MYFPLGWPKHLKNLQKGSRPLQYVISSCDRMLFAIITEDTLSIWYSKVRKKKHQLIMHTENKDRFIYTEEVCSIIYLEAYNFY